MTESDANELAALRDVMNRVLGLPHFGDDVVIRGRIGRLVAELTESVAKAKSSPSLTGYQPRRTRK